MMLRTLAAFSLGTLAASTAVASHAMTEARSAGLNATPAAAPAPTLAESILAMRDIDVHTGKRRQWSPTAQRLIDSGFLESLSEDAPKFEAAARNRAAGVERRQHGVIQPALVIPKQPSASIVVPYNLDGTPASTGRIHLKYRDGLGARASISGTTPVLSVSGQPLGGVNQLLADEGATVMQLIKHPIHVLEAVRKKAFDRSGRVQPDLAAMMVVELPGPLNWDRVVRVARSLNDIPEIEWVALEPTIATTQDCGEANPGNTYCNLPRNTGPKTLYEQRIACEESLVFDGASLIVPPDTTGTDCDPAAWLQQASANIPGYWDTAEWGERFDGDFAAWQYTAADYFYIYGPQNAQGSWAGDVTIPAATNGFANWAANYPLDALGIDPNECGAEYFTRTGCEDQACCDIVAAFLPECADADSTNGWDAFCAASANILCAGTIYDSINPNTPMPQRYDPCLSTYRPGGIEGAPGAPPAEFTFETEEECPPPNGGTDAGPPLTGTVLEGPQIAVAVPDGFWTEDPALAQRLPVFQFAAGFLGNCFEPQVTAGCNQPACCVTICLQDPACCTLAWDQDCVNRASDPDISGDVCSPPVSEPTPNFSTFSEQDGFTTGVQAFMTSDFYQSPFGAPLPVDTDDIGTAFRGSGFTGGGLDVAGASAAIGFIWRIYGSGNYNEPTAARIADPDLVWLGGAEWQVHSPFLVNLGQADPFEPGDGWVRVIRGEDPSPENPFPDFAVDADQIYTGMWLEPTGRKQQVAVCEFSAFTNHEEWCWPTEPRPEVESPTDNPPSIINVEAGQTLSYLNTSNAAHGIACLGVTTAPNNGFGVNGIAPYAEPWFFPIESLEEGSRATTAMISMVQDLDEGAVINHSWGPTAPGACLTSVPAYYTAIRLSTDAGLVVCLSAGNDGCSLIPEAGEVPSGGIIVGALEPGLTVPLICFSPRRINFSTHSGDELAVQACAWGIAGGTTGYGDLFRGDDVRNGLNVGEQPFVRTYTGPTFNNAQGGFSGTSFAGPQIAGCSALAQGAVRMFWNTTVNGDYMGGLVANAGNPSGGPYNCQTLGYPDECPLAQNGDGCNGICGDFLPPPPADPAGTLTNIGNFCSLPAAMGGALTIIEDPTQGTLEVYSGEWLRGNSISLSVPEDGLVFAVRSEPRVQGPGPEGLVYFASGETIDWGATVQIAIAAEDVINMELFTRSGASAYAAELPFVWNRSTQRWQLSGISILQFAEALHGYNVGGFATGQAPSVFVDENNAVRIRMYTVGLGFINGGFIGRWDWAALLVNDELNPL